MILQGVGLSWIALVATTGVSYESLVLPFVIAGIGVSMALASIPTAVLGAVAPPDMGKASGVNSTVQRFGSVFGVAVATAVFAANGHLGTPATYTAGFRPALAVAAAFSLLGGLTALGVGRKRSPAVTITEPEKIAA
jgi:MFS family permease